MCVQRFDDSRNSAIHITYRISLRSSSMPEPRDPLLKVFGYPFVSQIWSSLVKEFLVLSFGGRVDAPVFGGVQPAKATVNGSFAGFGRYGPPKGGSSLVNDPSAGSPTKHSLI